MVHRVARAAASAAISFLVATTWVSAVTISCPTGIDCTSGAGPFTVVQQVEPSYIEHLPLENLISWEVVIQNPGQALTFTGGSAVLRDEDGNAIAAHPYDLTEFELLSVVYGGPGMSLVPPGCVPVALPPPLGCSGVLIAAGTNLAVPFPVEQVGLNVVPASADMTLEFAEFPGEPIEITGVQLIEYRAPRGMVYSYPLRNHQQWPTINALSGGGHELGTAHRFAFNQRYSYDVGYVDGLDPLATSCCDGDDNTDFYTWERPVYAMADGVVDLLVTGNPNWPKPGMEPVGGTGTRGGGNIVTIKHDNGETQEWTFYAHLKEGSNDDLVHGQTILRGEPIGEVGNVGNTGGIPHMHFSSLDRPDPDPLTEARTFPTYFNNVVFPTPGHTVWRLQLDVAIPSDTVLTDLHEPPAPLPRNLPSAPGSVPESEPNDRLIQHHALSFPPDALVSGTAETGEVGDLAVRGDGIEDVFRIDLPAQDSLRVAVATQESSQNLDVYLLAEDLRVLNETGEGTAPAGPEDAACFDDLDPGAYYVFLTSADTIKTAAAPYELSIQSDPQAISVTVTNPTQPIEVDESCAARVDVEIAIHDNCCLDPDDLGLVVTLRPISNATLGEWVEDSRVVLDGRNVLVTGHVDVSALTSCPAEVRIDARAQDCDGRVFDTAVDGGAGIVDVIDTIPPSVTSSVDLARLWSPNHELIDVGFTATATDNCDAGVAETLNTEVWSDEPGDEPGDEAGDGNATPDASSLEGSLLLRAERQGMKDGRVYLLATDATDACGNRAFACATVGVVLAESLMSLQALDAQEQAALEFCQAGSGDAPAGFFLQGP